MGNSIPLISVVVIIDACPRLNAYNSVKILVDLVDLPIDRHSQNTLILANTLLFQLARALAELHT